MFSTSARVPSFQMKFSEVTILQGVEFSIFLLIFERALQQCSATIIFGATAPLRCLWCSLLTYQLIMMT